MTLHNERSRLADTFARMSRWPFGRWLFGRVVCWREPYFATLAGGVVMDAPLSGYLEKTCQKLRKRLNHPITR